MTQRNRRDDEEKGQENARSVDRHLNNENNLEPDSNESSTKFEQASCSGSTLGNRYRDNDLYERQNA